MEDNLIGNGAFGDDICDESQKEMVQGDAF